MTTLCEKGYERDRRCAGQTGGIIAAITLRLEPGGQVDAEGGALADLGGDFDPAAVALDDILAAGQPQAGALGFPALGGAFGREEGGENVGQELGRDAGP